MWICEIYSYSVQGELDDNSQCLYVDMLFDNINVYGLIDMYLQ